MGRTYRHLARWIVLLGLVWGGVSAAAPSSIVSGDDLVAWREMVRRVEEGADREAEYLSFLRGFPSSPLAERAWEALERGLGEEGTAEWRSELPPWAVRRWTRSLQAHRVEMARHPAEVVVAELSVEPSRGAPRIGVAMSWGGGFQSRSGFGVVGFRVGANRISGVLRVGTSGRAFVQGAVLGTTPVWWTVGRRTTVPFRGLLELSVDTLLRVGVSVGFRAQVHRWVWVELTGGAELDRHRVGPLVRLEVVHSF